MPFTLQQINVHLQNIHVDNNERTALFSYQELIAHFDGLKPLNVHNLIVGTHIVYGWMPKMLTLYIENGQFENIVNILNNLNENNIIQFDALVSLKEIINHSIVGVSKLLHFLYPSWYAIWDSRVYSSINGELNYYQFRKPQLYLDYLQNCRDVIEKNEFAIFHEQVNEKIGYTVSRMRAIEWVLYKNPHN